MGSAGAGTNLVGGARRYGRSQIRFIGGGNGGDEELRHPTSSDGAADWLLAGVCGGRGKQLWWRPRRGFDTTLIMRSGS